MELEEALSLIDTQKADLAKSAAQVESMQSKLDELLGETKKAKQKAKDEAEAAALALSEKAAKEGDFEQLLKSSEEERKKLNEQLGALTQSISQERVSSAAMKLASDLADGHNATLLSDFIARRLKNTDEGVRVLDSNGELTISSLEQLKTEFQADERFKSLVRGNQSSGGGATGGNGSAVEVNPFKKGEHFNLTKQADLMKSDPAKAAQMKATA
jgi:hypothetical protein